jgi:hypothetical protein
MEQLAKYIKHSGRTFGYQSVLRVKLSALQTDLAEKFNITTSQLGIHINEVTANDK